MRECVVSGWAALPQLLPGRGLSDPHLLQLEVGLKDTAGTPSFPGHTAAHRVQHILTGPGWMLEAQSDEQLATLQGSHKLKTSQ